MSEPPFPPVDDDDPNDAADAAWLVRDNPPTPAAAANPSPPPIVAEPGEQYDVAPTAEELARLVNPIVEETSNRKSAASAEPRARPMLEPSAAVEQVWSRGAEWGATIAILATTGFVLLLLLYTLVATEHFGAAALALIAGGLALGFLAYPILITLERPVRITPEQAVNDFYGALSHHFPHYRRMWLLLSTAGRTSRSFASFEGFSRYWNDRLAELRDGRIGSFTPLKFQVVEFKSDKSAGAAEVSARFRVDVSARGQSDQGPIASIPVEMDLVRGPDRMWYLNKGTLPNA